MAESTLSLTYDDIAKRVGLFLGWSADSTQWDGAVGTAGTKIDTIDMVIQSGLRMFYAAHDWTFLKPIDSITTTAADNDYDLEDDFGGLVGNLTYGEDEGYESIPIIGEGQIRILQQRAASDAKPKYACVRPKSATETTGQRFEIILWPAPDGAYTLSFHKMILPEKLATTKYALGGMAHCETIVEACLAKADEIMNSTPSGVHHTAYAWQLARSIERDRKQAPEYLGYNTDTSMAGGGPVVRRLDGVQVTVDGVEYP